MKKFYILILLILAMVSITIAQTERLKIEDIKHGTVSKEFSITEVKALPKNTTIDVKLDSTIIYNFSSASDSMVSRKILWSYIDNMDLANTHYWDSESNEWIFRFKWKYEYDENDNLDLVTCHMWDSDNNEWIGYWKEIYEYDEYSKLLLMTYYDWDSDNDEWIGFNKEEYEYDENDNRILRNAYYWDSENDEWIGYYNTEYEYDENGNLSNSYSWYDENDLGPYKAEYEYDENGKLILSVHYNWHFVIDEWTVSYKEEYEYDENGNQTLEVSYNWNNVNDEWVEDWKWEYEYDDDNNLILSTYYSGWDSENNAWIIDNKFFYYYSETVGISEKDLADHIRVFPNPAKKTVKVTSKDGVNRIDIYDITGNMVYRSKSQVTETHISTGNLINGVYILRIHTDKGIFKKKLQIQK